MTKPYIAIFTEQNTTEAALLVIFANRDAQALEDVAATRENLESQGEGPQVREFDRLADIPDIWDLRREAEEAKAREAAQSAAIAAQIPAESIAAIHQCLKMLAGCCDGARTLDGAGFNKLDTEFGRSLAESSHLSQKQAEYGRKLIGKYHRQLPDDLLVVAMGKNSAEPDVLSPAELINRKYQNQSGQDAAGNGCLEPYGDTYQVGVRPGPRKLAQFVEVLKLAGTSALSAQEDKGGEAMVYVKLFSTAGSWTWYITEFSEAVPDGAKNLAFGLVDGHEAELGYIDLEELANVDVGAGVEIDMHFKPQTLQACREAIGQPA
jgi:hypothetical protein